MHLAVFAPAFTFSLYESEAPANHKLPITLIVRCNYKKKNLQKMDKPYYIENLITQRIEYEKSIFKGSEKEFDNLIDEKLPELLTNITSGLMEVTYKYCLDKKSDLKKREKEINSKIKKNYGIGIQLFEGFLELNSKISSMTYDKYYKIFDNDQDHIKLDTLVANHVRACQVANEIKTMVTNGFADGAHARWRTLHEISVIFLYLYNSDYETIEMYNAYEVIETYKKAIEYNECCDELGLEPIEDSEIGEIKQQRDLLISKYGKEFTENYGWTMKDLPKGKRNFRELEKLVNLNYLRAIYIWSNESIHGGVSGIKTKLSLRENEQHYFLTGPNDCGFIDPIYFTSISLSEMSNVFLNMEDSLMNKILRKLLSDFQNLVVEEFEKSENNCT
jgi:hypothetical protein